MSPPGDDVELVARGLHLLQGTQKLLQTPGISAALSDNVEKLGKALSQHRNLPRRGNELLFGLCQKK